MAGLGTPPQHWRSRQRRWLLSGRINHPDDYITRILQPEVWLPLREISIAAGNVADNAMYTAAPGAELLTNPSFDSGGTGWIETLNGGSSSYVGGQAQITAPGGNLAAISQAVATLGDTYDIVADIASLTGNAQVTMGGGTESILYTTPGAKNSRHVAVSASFSLRTATGGGVVTWNEASVKKSGEYDGRYVGPTLAGDTFMGQPCPTFDGVNDYVQLEHNRLEALLKPEDAGFEMTMMIPVKMSQANWESTTVRGFMIIGVDANNRMMMYHSGTSNAFTVFISIGGVNTVVTQSVNSSHHGKFALLTFTMSKPNNRINSYINKTAGNPQAFPSGTWTASALTAGFSLVGALAGSSFLAGSAASPFIWDRELSAAEIGNIYDLMKIHEPNMS